MRNLLALGVLAPAILAPALLASGCTATLEQRGDRDEVELLVLGTVQDGGAPHLNCHRPCCEQLRAAGLRIPAASIALTDRSAGTLHLVDATPDIREQLHSTELRGLLRAGRRPLDSILLTHAHIGHYLGLAFFGRESMAADHVPVHASPQMCRFLETNAPWDLLVRTGHIELIPLAPEQDLALGARLAVRAFTVPHRDEYADTLGLEIRGPQRRAIYLPDVDRIDAALWARLMACDLLLLDGTFYSDGELGDRDMSAIPHPRIAEVLARWRARPPAQRPQLYFIHLNHTNPALDPASAQAREVERAGAHIARPGLRLAL